MAINRLHIENMFTHKNSTFEFEKGTTGIVGPNESGKSLIIEAIRYALFGSKALRGQLEDYKKLVVELDFTIGGSSYKVTRRSSKTELSRNGEPVAIGTKPVNAAIQNALGYDLMVFDVANACNQGNVEALSSMMPADRKAMVDRTVGLNVLDDLISFCGAEGNTLKRSSEAFLRGLSVPVQPLEPDNFRDPLLIRSELTAAEADLQEYNQLLGFLSRVPDQPVAPAGRVFSDTEADLRASITARRDALALQADLKRQIGGIIVETHTAAELTEFEIWMDSADAWKRKTALLAKGEHVCPKCDHHWPIAGDDLTALEQVKETAPPSMTRQQLASYRAQIGNADRKAALQAQLDVVQVPEDQSAELAELVSYENAKKAYTSALKAFDSYHVGLEAKAARFTELTEIGQTVTALRTELTIMASYVRDLGRYVDDLVAYQAKVSEGNAIAAQAAEYVDAKARVQALKIAVKSHLVPSLNKVASILLAQMTGGERSLVAVDENFEIMIDGQLIGTLSGSGKAVANLAIRIALGQVLTNKMFSVFMADEVDAAMDDERATYTAGCLQKLTQFVGQVILVSHKTPMVDHLFELKKKKNQ